MILLPGPILWGAKENGYRQLWSLDQLCQVSRWSHFGMNESIFNIQLTSAVGGILFIDSTILKSSFLLKKKAGGGGVEFLWKFSLPLYGDQELGPEPQPSLREHKVRHLNVRGAQSRETAGRVLVGDFSFLTMKVRVFLNLVVSFLFLWDCASSF